MCVCGIFSREVSFICQNVGDSKIIRRSYGEENMSANKQPCCPTQVEREILCTNVLNILFKNLLIPSAKSIKPKILESFHKSSANTICKHAHPVGTLQDVYYL